jgi:hypothetical protein
VRLLLITYNTSLVLYYELGLIKSSSSLSKSSIIYRSSIISRSSIIYESSIYRFSIYTSSIRTTIIRLGVRGSLEGKGGKSTSISLNYLRGLE